MIKYSSPNTFTNNRLEFHVPLLFQSINDFFQEENQILFALFHIAFWLFHVDLFLLITMKEINLHIHLLNLKTKAYCQS